MAYTNNGAVPAQDIDQDEPMLRLHVPDSRVHQRRCIAGVSLGLGVGILVGISVAFVGGLVAKPAGHAELETRSLGGFMVKAAEQPQNVTPSKNATTCRAECKTSDAEQCIENCTLAKLENCTDSCLVSAPGYKNAGNCTLCTAKGTAKLSSCYATCHLQREGAQICMGGCLGMKTPGGDMKTMTCLGEKIKCLFVAESFQCGGTPLDCDKAQIDCNNGYEQCSLALTIGSAILSGGLR